MPTNNDIKRRKLKNSYTSNLFNKAFCIIIDFTYNYVIYAKSLIRNKNKGTNLA